jgi:hypothetical protein
MPEFRIYTIGRDGRFSDVEIVDCADDQKAIRKAQQAVMATMSSYGSEAVLSHAWRANGPFNLDRSTTSK